MRRPADDRVRQRSSERVRALKLDSGRLAERGRCAEWIARRRRDELVGTDVGAGTELTRDAVEVGQFAERRVETLLDRRSELESSWKSPAAALTNAGAPIWLPAEPAGVTLVVLPPPPFSIWTLA